MELMTDFPERLKPDSTLYLGDKHKAFVLRSVRTHNEGVLVGFVGIDSPEDAGKYRNWIAYVSGKGLPKLSEGEFYFHEMIGLSVITEDGDLLGAVTEVLETGANDVYVVQKKDGAEILLPAISDVILSIDLKTKLMTVHLLPGLLDGGV